MMNCTSRKRAILTLTTAALVCALTIPAIASTVITRTINAQFGVGLTLNGLPFAPKDVNGKAVEPMVIDGTTYLPVRALGEATGTVTRWNAETNTVEMYTSGNGDWIPVDRTFVSMMREESIPKRLSYNYFDYVTDKSVIKENSKQDYETAFIYTGSHRPDTDSANISIKTNREYNEIQFNISIIHNTADTESPLIYVVDANTGTIYRQVEITEANQTITADISGAKEIRIKFERGPGGYLFSGPEETRQITIGDMKLR